MQMLLGHTVQIAGLPVKYIYEQRIINRKCLDSMKSHLAY